jgi:magnesium transporter
MKRDSPRPLAARARRRRGPPAGARPGAFSVPADAPPPRIRVIAYGPEGCQERTVTDVATLRPPASGPGVTWIDVEGFGDQRTLEAIREAFGIHPLAMADIVNSPQRPKLEDYDDQYLIVARMARVTERGEIDLEQVSLIHGKRWVLTFQEHPGDVFEPIRERLRNGTGALQRMGADYLVYALLDAIVDEYFVVLEHVGSELEEVEEEVMGRPSQSVLARIHGVRRTLLDLHRIQWGQREMLNRALRDESGPFGERVRVYLRDVHDHAIQILDVIETYRETVAALMEIYLSSVSNRLNEVMKTLTVMASIFIPLTFVVGIYGMNFEYMPELHWRHGYAMVWGLMLVVAGALVAWFWRRGWLGGGR